jgi:hypothetical protein
MGWAGERRGSSRSNGRRPRRRLEPLRFGSRGRLIGENRRILMFGNWLLVLMLVSLKELILAQPSEERDHRPAIFRAVDFVVTAFHRLLL